MTYESINHPKHYNEHPSGVECIEIVEHMNFCLGNAVKYIWRAGLKSDDPIEDLEKARWYLGREIRRLKGILRKEAIRRTDDIEEQAWKEAQERQERAAMVAMQSLNDLSVKDAPLSSAGTSPEKSRSTSPEQMSGRPFGTLPGSSRVTEEMRNADRPYHFGTANPNARDLPDDWQPV